MITITLGVMNKKPNSTKQSVFGGVDVSITLKRPVSIKTPVFVLNTKNLGDISGYNYIIWENRYYWITNISHSFLSTNIVEISANLDLLATYKSVIINCSGLIKYCNNPNIKDYLGDDGRLSPDRLFDISGYSVDYEETLYKKANIFGDDSDIWDSEGNGVYVIQTVSSIGTKNYILSSSQFESVINYFSTIAGSITSWFTDMIGFDNWRDAINSCLWYPFDYDNFVSKANLSKGPFNIGGITMDGTATTPNLSEVPIAPVLWAMNFSGKIEIPRIPDGPNFMKKQRWCTYQIETPFGFQDINADLCYGNHRYICFSTCFAPGDGQMNIKYSYDGNDAWNNVSQTELLAIQGNIGTDALHLVAFQQSFEQSLFTSISAGAVIGASLGAATTISAIGSSIAAKEISEPSGSDIVTSIRRTEDRLAGKDIPEIKTNNQDIEQSKNATISLGPNLVNAFKSPGCSSVGGSGTSGSGITNLFNTVELGLTKLRRKQFTCTELQGTATNTPNQKYEAFCSVYGYPVNNIYSIYNCIYTDLGEVYDRSSVFVQGIVYIPTNIAGMNQMEANALEQIITNGIWIE